MNYRYINNINLKSNRMRLCKRNKMPEVIQIGVGGAPLCGKTVLIDAMFSVLDTQDYPGYLPVKSNFSVDCSDDIFEGKYKNYAQLRNFVSSYFHDPSIKTEVEEGRDFGSNTYWLNIQSNGKKCILLIRNLPGEMFDQYFNTEFFSQLPNRMSLNVVFDNFVSQHEDYRTGQWKNFFKSKSEQDLLNLKDAFKAYLVNTYPLANDNTRTKLAENDNFQVTTDDFYAYIFYKSSDTMIRCVRANITDQTNDGKKSQEIKINNDMVNAGQMKNDYICITQFDRILETPTSEFRFAGNQNRWHTYATKMSEIYNDIKDNSFSKVKRLQWYEAKPQRLFQQLYYISSVAFYWNEYEEKDDDKYKFLGFSEDASTEKWQSTKNQYRTPLGVVELVSNILKKHNITLPLPKLTDKDKAKTLNEFIKRM